MALRMASQRWTSSPLVQSVMRYSRQQQIRAFADEYTGRALDDKEKAAETRYIRKMEEEQRLKKEALGESSESAAPAGEATPSPGTETPAAPAKDSGYMNTAVVAGIVAAIAGYFLLSGSSKKKDDDKDST